MAAGRSGSRARRVAPIARMAPSPSSQARVMSEKKAHGALTSVSHSETTNEMAMTAPATIAIQRPRSARPRVRRTVRSTRAGQKK